MNTAEQIYQALFQRWGEQHWWPADSPLEMILGAMLTQNTNWKNVENVIQRLKSEQAIDLNRLANVSTPILEDWIRPAGFFRQKARTIQTFARHLQQNFNGSIQELFKLDTPTLRSELLNWHGIGPESADSILLYAAQRPVFVIDAYTKRFMVRHNWTDETAAYDALATFFTDQLQQDPKLYNEFHALIVQLGKTHCRTTPQCENCPLRPMLTHPISV
jgi:endonuclease-3 related protein